VGDRRLPILREISEKVGFGLSNPAGQHDVILYGENRSPHTTPEEATMKYMLLLRQTNDAGPAEGTPEFDAEMAKWGELMGELAGSGALIGAQGLDTEATATTVRTRDGDSVVTDGPFAETKESFFSYIVIDVADLDAALAWAKRMPNVTYGSVEIRPLSIHEQDA
jgi:hypothetical protein